jgi:hypothetical protein
VEDQRVTVVIASRNRCADAMRTLVHHRAVTMLIDNDSSDRIEAAARVLTSPRNDDHGPGSRHPRCRRAAGTQVDARHRQHDDEAGQPRAAPAAGRPVVVRVTVRDRFVVTVTMRVERRSGATRTDHFRSAVW